MATIQGITGKLSGKMGSAVFRVRNGQQVVAQYNPIVKNPNTEKQQASRAALKLISQLGAIMSPGFGTMGITKRPAKGQPTQRNAFTALNYELIQTEQTEEGVVAKIPMEQLQLTSSFRELGLLSAVAGENKIRVQIELADSAPRKGKILLVGYGTMGVTRRQAKLITIVDVPVQDGVIEYDFADIPEGDYTVLAYGLIPSESGAKKVDLDNIHTPDDEAFISAVQLAQMVADGEMAETKTMGANVRLSA